MFSPTGFFCSEPENHRPQPSGAAHSSLTTIFHQTKGSPMTTRGTLPALLLAIAGLAASSAHAQCTWFIDDVPDFDQRRLASGGVDGLPGNGGMYCVPTSFTNWFAYLANRGLPQAITLSGPRDWQSNSNYNRVTDTLALMGTLMETHATEGTKGKAVSGATLYSLLTMAGDVVITGQSIWGGGSPSAPSPQMLYDLHRLGAYTAGTYGFYGASTGGTRNGGHAITFNGVWDSGCGQSSILEFRDPADESANNTQADFRTSLAALTPVNGTFFSTGGGSSRNMTLYRMDITTASNNFLDAIYVIMPMAALFGGGGLDAGELRLVRPFLPQGNPGTTNAPFNKPAGTGPVLDVVMSSDPAIHYYITGAARAAPASVWRLNILTGISTRIIMAGATGFDPKRLAYGRLGDLYVVDGDRVGRYNPTTTPATAIGGFAPSITPDAIAYDDKTDRIVILTEAPTIGSRRLLVYPYTLSGFGTDRAVPATYAGSAFVQPDAETNDAFFICSDGSGVLRRFIGQGGNLVETDSILHLNGSLTALNVTDSNRLIYANNGTLVEKEEDAQGSWVNRPNSRWAGRAATGGVSIARSRTNHLASVMEGPSFNNLANPTLYPRLPACKANCDDSSVAPILNINDFVCFQMKFAQGHPYANCDNSTTPPILNVNDFICFQTKYALGCP